jgi:hypothetical protein
MATSEQVAEVRKNTNEMSDDDYTDPALDALIDGTGGVNAASATIWRQKAAKYAHLVDIEEAGASHDFSDLHKNALDMAKQFDGLAVGAGEVITVSMGHARVKVIDRAYGE